MVYAYDQWAQLPIRDLYDSQIMAMAINAAKDMYEKGQAEMKEFQKEYGDFMTPISADQDWWQQNVNDPVRNTINAFYEQGIDPLRNPQARAMISKMINSMPYGQMALKQTRAKNAEEYYKNMAALRLNDKYNEDFSRYLGEDPSQWAPNSTGVTSPTAFKTLKEATNDWYNNRSARDLTAAEIAQMGLDPRYQYQAFLDSDLMNIAKGQTPGWQGTPQASYYRELAKRQLQAIGEQPTPEKIEAQLQRNIANAQQEWLMQPVQKDADKFELMKQQLKDSLALQHDAQAFQEKMADKAAKDKLDQIRARYGDKTANGGKGDANSQNYSLTESIHHDMLFQGLRNSGIPIIALTKDANGNMVPKKDKDGKFVHKNPNDATWEELEYTANLSNQYIYSQQELFGNLSQTGTPKHMEHIMRNKYGARITGIQAAAMLKKQPQKDGGFIISSGEAKLLRGTKGITSDVMGSKFNITYNDRLSEIYDQINNTIKNENILGAEIKFNITDTGNNAMQVSEKFNHGRLETYVNGTVTIIGKDKDGKPISKVISTNAWLPLGLNSENVAGNVKNTRSNVALSGANQSAYSSIDANYLKQMGQQQKSNIGLFANSSMPMMIDPQNMDVEDLIELLELNQ